MNALIWFPLLLLSLFLLALFFFIKWLTKSVAIRLGVATWFLLFIFILFWWFCVVMVGSSDAVKMMNTWPLGNYVSAALGFDESVGWLAIIVLSFAYSLLIGVLMALSVIFIKYINYRFGRHE